MTRPLRPLRHVARLLLVPLLGALALTSCGSDDVPGAEPAAPGTAQAAGAYPLTLTSPYGETVLAARPTRVAVVSSVDLDIALALGVVPVTSPRYGDTELDPWETEAAAGLGTADIATYDSTDGTDMEAIAAADPDVILATSGWTLEDDYARLSAIAPVVSYAGDDGLTTMTWRDRTTAAAAALGVPEQGSRAVAAVDQAFADARAANPAFAGKTVTYAVLHPGEITYSSWAGADNEFFTSLGFTLPENAKKFSATSTAVSRENISVLDADVLAVGYPFGDEGLLTRTQLEQDPLFTSLQAVRGGHYLVISDAVASPLAYPTPLSQAWVLRQLLPSLQQAVAGS